jgi:spore germination cell wall hydrolase CwlJ-like protein
MFKSLLVACAAITLAFQVVGMSMAPGNNRAYADTAPQELVIARPEKLEVAPVKVAVALPIISEADLDCMTENIYFEARNQSVEGQYAVAEVVMNRLAAEEFPKTVCEVIKQKSTKNCQFSWYCDGLPDVMTDKDAEARARLIARSALLLKTNFTNGAKYYHAEYVSPKWAEDGKVKQIQDHIFYTRI